MQAGGPESEMQGAFNVDWDHMLDDDGLDEETSRLYRQKVDEFEVAHHSSAVRNRRVSARPAPRGGGRGGAARGAARGARGAARGARGGRGRGRRGVVHRAGEDGDGGEGEEEEEEEEDEQDAEDTSDEDDYEEDADDDAGGGPAAPAAPDGGGDPAAPAAAQPAARRRDTRVAMPHPPAQRFTLEGKQFFVVHGDARPRPGIFGHYLKPFTVDEDDECVPFPKPDDYDPNAAKTWAGKFIEAGWPGQPWPSESLVNAVKPFWKQMVADWIPASITPAVADWSRNLLPAYRAAMTARGRQDASLPFMIERRTYHDNQATAQRDVYFHMGPPGDLDPSLPPNVDACTPGVDFVECPGPLADPQYYEVGSEFLKKRVEEGEALDFAFARRMQGLLGVAQDHVWACLDPSFNPADRPAAMERFSAAYTGSFYKSVAWQDQQDPRAVSTEALQQHKAFCEEWVHKHYRTLTPTITAAAEALVADFYDSVRDRMPKGWVLSVARFARLLMRHPSLSQYFGVCLQSYMTSLDQARPGRNASYKAMNTATVMRFQSFKRFVKEFEAHAQQLYALYKELSDLENFHFHQYVVDWYEIAGQLPETHRFFARPQDNLLLKRLRNPQGQGRAPWLVGRE